MSCTHALWVHGVYIVVYMVGVTQPALVPTDFTFGPYRVHTEDIH